MTAPADVLTAEWDLLNDQTPSQFADRDTRSELWNTVEDEIDGHLALIQTPQTRRVVLTSRTGSIPLRFRNGLDGEVRLLMRTRSPRLEFPQGAAQEIVLAPGENRIDVPVEVRAPGSSLLRIELSSPDRTLAVGDVTVTVRSSSISGVGAVLSVMSLLVLALWWIRSHRRRSSPSGRNGDGDGDRGSTDGGTVGSHRAPTADG